jgi:peptidyl-prolyl cis-trans isomerase B (cyclophilin B)
MLAILATLLLMGQPPAQTPPPANKPPVAKPKKEEKPKQPKPQKPKKQQERPVVTLETAKGTVVIELEPTEAPIAVSNFISLAQRGFYDGLIFHRVEADLVQGGDPLGTGAGGPGYTISFEQNRGLKNLKGVIGMARGPEKDSAGSQFYILKKDAPGFDLNGYTLFGRVTSGLEIVEKLVVGDKITRATVTVPTSFKPRAFGPTHNAEPQALFYPLLPDDIASRTYTKTVKVKVIVSATGSADITLTRGTGDEEIDDAIVAAMRQWQWQPALRTGQPVAQTLEFVYDLATHSRRVGG